VTAIRLGDRDGNPRTEAGPDWGSFVPTPPFPSYPSGAASFGAVARRVLERMFGPDGHTITLASPLVPDVVLRHTSWKQITADVDDARVYGGVHYRFDLQRRRARADVSGAACCGTCSVRCTDRRTLRPGRRSTDDPEPQVRPLSPRWMTETGGTFL
jgi:hypothetical protein